MLFVGSSVDKAMLFLLIVKTMKTEVAVWKKETKGNYPYHSFTLFNTLTPTNYLTLTTLLLDPN